MKVEAYWDLAQLSQVKTGDGAAKALEEEFVHLLLKEMRKEFEHSSLFGGSFAGRIYYSLFDMQLAKIVSDNAELGIKEYIEEAIRKYGQNGDG